MYVVDFPFNKVARLHSEAYYWIKKDAFLRSAQKGKNALAL